MLMTNVNVLQSSVALLINNVYCNDKYSIVKTCPLCNVPQSSVAIMINNVY